MRLTLTRATSCLFLFVAAVSAQTTLGDAQRAFEAGDFAEAVRIYRVAIDRDGPSYAAFLGLGKALFEQREDAAAVEALAAAARLDPKAREPWVYLAVLSERRARETVDAGERRSAFSQAIEWYDAAAKLSEDSYDVNYWAAECALELRDVEKALAEVDAALRQRPDDPAAAQLRLRILREAGRATELLSELDEFRRTHGENSFVVVSELEALAKLGRIGEARRRFLAVTAPESEYHGDPAPFDTMLALWKDDRRAALRELFEAATQRDPNDPLAVFYLADVDGLDGRYEAAARGFRRYIEFAPRVPAGYRQLALAELAGKRLDAAHTAIVAGIEQTSAADLVPVARQVAFAWVERREFGRALELQEMIVGLTPTVEARRDLAILHKELGQLDQAESELRALIDEVADVSQRAGLVNDLALNLKGQGRSPEAEATFREAIRLDPTQLDARENLAVLLFDSERFDEAEAQLERILDMDPRRERARYYLRAVRRLADRVDR